jgi:hypothetical protein
MGWMVMDENYEVFWLLVVVLYRCAAALGYRWIWYWGERDSELRIVTENGTFIKPMQNIYQVQMTTEKCRWRRKRTDLSRNSEVFIVPH